MILCMVSLFVYTCINSAYFISHYSINLFCFACITYIKFYQRISLVSYPDSLNNAHNKEVKIHYNSICNIPLQQG